MRRRLAAFLAAVLALLGVVAVPQVAHADAEFILTPNGVVSVERSWPLWTLSKSIADPMSSVLLDGDLPDGLILSDTWDDSEFGGLSVALQGTPTTPGYYEFEVGVVDGNDNAVAIAGTRTFGITIVAIQSGTTPTFSPVTRLTGGYSFTITSHLGGQGISYSLDVLSTDGATDPSAVAVVRSTALVTVSGLAEGESATLEVTAHRYGYTDESAQITGQALISGIDAEFGAPEWINHGFTVVISNWDDEISYTPVLLSPVDHGTVVLDGDTITVAGLDPEEEAIVEVLAEHPDRSDAISTVAGTAPPWEDGNLDEVTDYIQPWVVKVYDAGGTKIYLETDPVSVCEIGGTQLLEIGTAPDGYQMAHAALLGFQIVGCADPGFTTTVSWYFHGIDGEGLTPYKYHPTAGVFLDIPDATLETVEVSAGVVAILSYSITDGGPLDADGATDNAIRDPVGLFGVAEIAEIAETGAWHWPAFVSAALLSLLGLAALSVRLHSRPQPRPHSP